MRTQQRSFRLIAGVAISGLLFGQLMPLPVFAQGAPPPQPGAPDQQAGDPPARVGRLARVSGTVSFHTQDDTQWSPATANYPVATGNAFWTEPNAQAEIQVSASRVAMAPGSELDITMLSDTAFQASEPQGEAYLRVRAAVPNETYALQTPRGLVTFAVPGRYAVAAGDTQSPTLVTVVDGSAEVTDANSNLSLQVGPNQTATISGTDTFTGSVGPAQPDAFLTAMLAREQPAPAPQAAAAPQVAPPPQVAAMPGGDDLAEYGAWSESPQYGEVWYPQVAPGWVPYREGHWAYVAPWGWTWVDNAPWGFAPFHYGRWVNYGGRWGWTPGVMAVGMVEPVYAPALVTFFGIGVGIGIGAALAGGQVGWCPLGPGEAYRPWYHASDRYVQSVNVSHVTNITTMNRNTTINNYANASAATVVPASALTSSQPVNRVAQHVTSAQLAQARPVIGQQPLRPTAATAGVTPAVARQLQLPAAPQALHPAAPGPAIRPLPAGVTAGALTGAGTGRPQLLPLHNPTLPAPAAIARPPSLPGGAPGPAITPHVGAPAAAGAPGALHVAPALRPPAAAGPTGAPGITHAPGITGAPGPHPAGVVAPGAVPHVGVPAAAPMPPIHAAPPAAVHAAPAAPVAHPAPAVVHPAAPTAVHAAPPVAHPAPAVVHPAPSVQFHPAPPAVHAAPPAPQVHAAPPAVHPAPAPAHPAPNKRPGES